MERINRLHRDISVGNIVLVRKGDGELRTGILIDWEKSSIADEYGSARDNDRGVSLIRNARK